MEQITLASTEHEAIIGALGLVAEVPFSATAGVHRNSESSLHEASIMLDVTPILKNGRAEIRLRNSGHPPIVVNKILLWREGRPRPEIRDLLSGQLIHIPPHTEQAVDITEAVLAMTGNTGPFAVWMVFELDPHCQRFPVRFELDIDDGRVTRFIEQYPE